MNDKLDPKDPTFISALPALLSSSPNGVSVKNFLGLTWNVFYDLYNPENFEDPENSPEWYDSSEFYEVFENGFRDPSSVRVFGTASEATLSVLRELIHNASSFEGEIVDYFIQYTFGGGGAYAASQHFEFARRTLELFHKQSMTQKDFIERTICLNSIVLEEGSEVVELRFHCGWDFEHGVSIKVNQTGLATEKRS